MRITFRRADGEERAYEIPEWDRINSAQQYEILRKLVEPPTNIVSLLDHVVRTDYQLFQKGKQGVLFNLPDGDKSVAS